MADADASTRDDELGAGTVAGIAIGGMAMTALLFLMSRVVLKFLKSDPYYDEPARTVCTPRTPCRNTVCFQATTRDKRKVEF